MVVMSRRFCSTSMLRAISGKRCNQLPSDLDWG
nr:MAG TPA: hypothetical protein [Caudoviricetes sp.]